jgi:gamma-glutamyltranspeptidase / glutathione hydrolase
MPPSSSGGIAVLQILGELERFDMAAVRPNSAEAVHLVTEAERLAFADRDRYVADDRFVEVPVRGLLDRDYLAQRSQLIRRDRTMGKAQAGHPAGATPAYAEDATDDVPGTSHLVVVDRRGNAAVMTTSIEWAFGSGVMVRGFFLNNELTDFSFVPRRDGRVLANAVAPGKRPRSSMAPFLVFDRASGRLDAAIGSAGGSFIIGYVTKALVAMLDWNMSVQDAVELPNYDSRNAGTEIEKGTALEALAPALRSLGHEVAAIEMTSGLHGVRRSRDGWDGGADPRREGVARGR